VTSSPKVEGLADDTTETATDGSADAGTDQPSATKGMHKHPMRANHVVRLCFRALDNPHSSPRYHLSQFAAHDGNRILFDFSGYAMRLACVVTADHDDADRRGRRARDLGKRAHSEVRGWTCRGNHVRRSPGFRDRIPACRTDPLHLCVDFGGRHFRRARDSAVHPQNFRK